MIDIPGGRFQYSGFNTIFSDIRNLTPLFYRLLSFDHTLDSESRYGNILFRKKLARGSVFAQLDRKSETESFLKKKK